MNGGGNHCEDGICQFSKDPKGDLVPKGRHYALCGPQAEPGAALWLRDAQPASCSTIRLPVREEVTKLAGNLDDVFPNTENKLEKQFQQLLTLQALRDVPFGELNPPIGPCLSPQPGGNGGGPGVSPKPAGNAGGPGGNGLPQGLSLTPTSRFLDLQPVPFGAVFNTAFPASRPQFRVEDVADWRSRIELPRVIVCTGRELARLFENETPGLYHRHALNWLLFNRPDVSPPRQARVWMALDMAIYTALTAAWYYKWLDPRYRFLQRPAEYALQTKNAEFEVLFDRMVARSGDGDYARRTCPDVSPGTPRHPALPSGHSTYSAAASYLLEFFFAPEARRKSDAAVARAAGKVEPPDQPTSPDWIANELRRLANNIGEARLWGGVHWADDHRAGQRIGRAAAQAVIDRYLEDCVPVVNTEPCEKRRDECPPHPEKILPVSCKPDQESVRQRASDKDLREDYGVL